MNAVTTAEYVVIVRDNVADVGEEINTQAKQGYRLVSFETNPENKWEAPSYSAVMAREPKTSVIYRPELQFEQILEAQRDITKLKERVTKLELRANGLERDKQRMTNVLGDQQRRIEELEAKIDWSK